MRHDNTVPARIEWAPAAVPTASQDSGQDKMKRYEKFADEIAELIRTGASSPPGRRCPRYGTPAVPTGSALPPCSRPTTCWKAVG